jgi:hypothetical protein
MTFWGGSGSADSCLVLMDPNPYSDPDPAIFVLDLPKMATKNEFKKNFFGLLLFEGTCTSFSKIKSQKEVKKQ